MQATSWRFLALAALLLSVSRVVQSQTDLCSDGTTVGYSSLAALVTDEVNLPAVTTSTSDVRGYVLCPGTVFQSAWTPIVSSGQPIVLLCGQNGDPSNNCTIPGVSLSSPISTHISVVGATFTGFTQAAIRGTASSNTTVEVRNAIFRVSDTTISFPCCKLV